LAALKNLFEGKMENAEAILAELGFEKDAIGRLDFQLELECFANQVLDLLIDDLKRDVEILVYEKAQEML
jgi:hypothetical protein